MRLGTHLRGSTSSDSRWQKIRKAGGFVVEELEQRVLLSATLRSQIPNSITPASVPQTVLAPGNISATLTPTSTAPVSSSFRFVLNNATAGELTQFSTVESASGGPTDAAIALYDASGNLITLQDADPSGSIANESLSAALTSGQQYEVAFYAERISTTGAQ